MSLDTYRTLIQDSIFLLREESCILASREDADYFRSLTKRGTPMPKPAPPPVRIAAPPPQPPPPKIAEPPPAPAPPTPEPASWREPTQLPAEPLNSAHLRSLLQKIAPHLAIIDDIPNDTLAKKIATRWKTKNQIAPISVLCLGESDKQKKLLEEITKAIDVYFGPARLIPAEPIEKEKQWEAFLSSTDLKLVIACDYTIWQLSDLMRHYKEIPAQQTRTLGNIPLFLLPDLSLYLKDPLLKRSLWKALCQVLSS